MMEISKQDASILLQLLDLAQKAGGLNVSNNCLYFATKAQEVIDKPEPQAEIQSK